MADEFHYDVFLSHSAKDKAVVRPLAERLRTDGVKVWFDEWVQMESQTFRFRNPLNKEQCFISLWFDDTPIKGSQAKFLYIKWLQVNRRRSIRSAHSLIRVGLSSGKHLLATIIQKRFLSINPILRLAAMEKTSESYCPLSL